MASGGRRAESVENIRSNPGSPMATETLTLRLQGDVPLADFARAIARFSELVKALTEEVGDPTIDWTVADLERGSVEATVLGTAPKIEPLVRVRNAYLNIGRALEASEPIAYPEKIRKPASGLQAILNGRTTEAIFETSQAEAIVRAAPLPASQRAAVVTKGAVSGRVQTLTNRGSLRFTLYDLLHDRPVSCYLAEGREDLMRDAWGKLAVVEGTVRRHPITGRPLTVRNVTAVDVRPDPSGDAYTTARGAVPLLASGLMPEDAIRHLRDG